MAQSESIKRKCSKCNLEINYDISLSFKIIWTTADQLSFHKKLKCAYFDFKPVNYLWFRPIVAKGFIDPIPYLPEEVGNVQMTYTGKSDYGPSKKEYSTGIIRAINQLFILKYNYEKAANDPTRDQVKADVYRNTIESKSKAGNDCLCLMFVRSSNDDILIQHSEHNMINTFRRHGETLFYNDYAGSKPKDSKINDNDLHIENYRRIEFKLKNKYYLKFTRKNIEYLENKFSDSQKKAAIRKGFLFSSIHKITDLEIILEYLYNMNPIFFTNQEPNDSSNFFERQQPSFFERKLQASIQLAKYDTHLSTYLIDPNGTDQQFQAQLRSVGLHAEQIIARRNNQLNQQN